MYSFFDFFSFGSEKSVADSASLWKLNFLTVFISTSCKLLATYFFYLNNSNKKDIFFWAVAPL